MSLTMSLIGTPILIDRYLNGAMPAWIVLAALGITGLATWPRRFLLGVAVVAVVFTWGLSTYWRHHAEDYRGVANQLRAELQPEDCIGFLPSYGTGPLSFYYPKKQDCSLIAADKVGEVITAG